MEISPYTMAVWLYQGQKLKKEKVMEYNKTAVALTTGITETVINICRKINPEMILMNACAFTRVINCAPNILKKIAGITQYIPPNGIPKSRKGSCPSLILYAPSHDKKIFTLKGKLKSNGNEAMPIIIKISKILNNFFCAILKG